MPSKSIIFNFTRNELIEILTKKGFPPYLGGQIFSWVYTKHELNPDNFTNISKENRKKIGELFDFSPLKVIDSRKSVEEETEKFLLRVKNGYIETVLMKQNDYYTQCVSSQVGCKLGCKFCATGEIGFKGNLSADEIVSQVATVKKATNILPKNLVYMGMGEPLLNYENVLKSIEILSDREGYDFGIRRITISTIGILDNLKKLVNRYPNIGIAISLNAIPEKRTAIIPAERKYPIMDIINFYRENKRIARPTLEYTLMDGINSSKEDAKKLLKLLKNIRCKINLIPYNENPKLSYKTVSEETLNDFIKILFKGDNAVTVRRSKGKDILGGCGQLSGEMYD